jgi:outer membrane protein assembly factor BamE (lipoprotein component of BamABCDE complex)
MKKFIPFLLLLAACHSNKKFDQVKVGMHSKDVVALVGDPESKQQMMTVEWWLYKSDNKMLIMSDDTVMRVVSNLSATQDSMKSALGKMDSIADSLKKDAADTTAK